MVNTHFQTFIDDDELIRELDNIQNEKNFKSRSQLTKIALTQYLELYQQKKAVDFLYEEWLQTKKDDFLHAVNYDEIQLKEKTGDIRKPICIRINGSWLTNPIHKDRCLNLSCSQQYCISIKINKLVNQHFTEEGKKFINTLRGENWRKEFINEFSTSYSLGYFEPGNTTTHYTTNPKISIIETWLKKHTHTHSKGSSYQPLKQQ